MIFPLCKWYFAINWHKFEKRWADIFQIYPNAIHLNPLQFCPSMPLLGFPVFCSSSSMVLNRYFHILVNSMTIWSVLKLPKIAWPSPFKQDKPGKVFGNVSRYIIYPVQELRVYGTPSYYINTTERLRNSTKLLVSFIKPYRAVTSSTTVRWIKIVLGHSGIDTQEDFLGGGVVLGKDFLDLAGFWHSWPSIDHHFVLQIFLTIFSLIARLPALRLICVQETSLLCASWDLGLLSTLNPRQKLGRLQSILKPCQGTLRDLLSN